MLLMHLVVAGLGHTYESARGRHGRRHNSTSAVVDNDTSAIVAIVLQRNTLLVRLSVVR